MKDKKRVNVLLKVIKTINNQNPEMIEVCAEEGVFPEELFFNLLFLLFSFS